jgi:hypothetical protein
MTEIDIDMPGLRNVARAARRIERVISGHKLELASRGTLKKYPGCIHWHCRRAGSKGTLEITLWPLKNRVWFKIQSGRRAAWIDELIPSLKRTLEA